MGNKNSLLLPQKMRVPATRLSASQEALKHEARLKRETQEQDPFGQFEGTREQDLSRLLDELSGAITSKPDESATPAWMVNKGGSPRARAAAEDPRKKYGVLENDLKSILSVRPSTYDHDDSVDFPQVNKLSTRFKLQEEHVRNLYRFTALVHAETVATSGGSGNIGIPVAKRPFLADKDLFSAVPQIDAKEESSASASPAPAAN